MNLRLRLVALLSLTALWPGLALGQERGLQMIVVLDPSCPEAGTMIDRIRDFRRLHPEVPLRLLVPDPGAFARAPEATLTALQRASLTLEWDPPALRALGVTATPAVLALDARGGGVKATGTPDLSTILGGARATRGRGR